MSREISVARMLTELQKRIADHERLEAFHAQQEAHHREQRALHAAELQTARERFAAFQAAADAAGELVVRSKGKPGVEEIELPPGKPVMISRLIARIIAGKEPEEVFGGISLAAEINQRFQGRLRRKVQHRSVAATLRRLAKAGYLRVVRPGRAVHEALYSRGEDWD